MLTTKAPRLNRILYQAIHVDLLATYEAQFGRQRNNAIIKLVG